MIRINDIYPKVQHTEKIIQFGEGGFLRGFADWIIQLTNEASDFNAGVTVVQPIENGLCTQLEQQNCLYTHIARGIINGQRVSETKIIDAIDKTIQPYQDFNSYLALAKNANYRFILSNTTESGIVFDENDTPDRAPYVTFPAKVTLLLQKRFSLGLGGFIFLPCELIDRNGDTLKKYILKYARQWELGENFIHWLETENIFCNTLVDRIVTGYPKDEPYTLEYEDHMLNTSELFHLWVIEGPPELAIEFPFQQSNANIICTDNLEPYRTRKVRILNGAHTAMIPYAMLEGIETVRDCMQNETMYSFAKRCVYDEIIPTLDLPKAELIDYADSVFERFKNPYIRHYCASISLNSVSKFKVRVLPSILEYIKRKKQFPPNLMLSFAKLIQFYQSALPNDNADVIHRMQNPDLKTVLADQTLWEMDLSSWEEEIARRLTKL